MSEWVIVAIVGVVLLFSARKLPDMARGLGQSMRIFKAETRGMKDDDERARGQGEPQAPGRQLDESTGVTGTNGVNGTAPGGQDASPTTRPGTTSS